MWSIATTSSTSCWPRPSGAKKLRIFVRIATPLGGAVLELSSKFGTTPADAGASFETRRRVRRGSPRHLPCRLAMPVARSPMRRRSRWRGAPPDRRRRDRGAGYRRRISRPLSPATTCRPITGISTPSRKRSRRLPDPKHAADAASRDARCSPKACRWSRR